MNTIANINYPNLSKEEFYLISRAEYEKLKLITSPFARRLFGSAKRAARILDGLTRKKLLIQLQRGKYLPVPIKAPNQEWAPNEFIVAGRWMGEIPYYVGYFTMYQYWGLTDQVPQTIFILNTKKNDKKTIANVKYVALKIDPRKYYGVERIRIEDEEVCVSDRERTWVDFIYNPIGSFDHVRRTLKENMKKINLPKFVDYLIRFPVVSIRKRAGFLLEGMKCPPALLRKLRRSIGTQNTYVVLDPANQSRKGKINREWKIIVNR